jgi:hypothetical protein
MLERLFPGIRTGRPRRTIGRMEHNSRIIAVAAEAVLDRRLRADDAKIAAAAQRIGGGPEHRAAAEFHAGAFIMVVRELDRAGLDGRTVLQAILDNNRHLAAIR